MVLCVVCAAITAFSYWKVAAFAKPYLYASTNQVPYCKAALLLGTSAKNRAGADNLFFVRRIAAAANLYKASKMKYIIVSGDNSRNDYNEPEDMRQALIAAGVPDTAIVLDYAGFRTFDSVVRCKEIFGQDSVIIISQPFHNERAVYIARKEGMEAVAFNAENVNGRYSIKTNIREWFARVKVLLDVHVLNTEPHFGGEKIELR
jgi:SanA protein